MARRAWIVLLSSVAMLGVAAAPAAGQAQAYDFVKVADGVEDSFGSSASAVPR